MSSCNKWFTGLNRTFIPLKVLSLAENIPFLSLHHACCNYSYTAVTDNLLCHHLSPAITNLFYKPHYRIWLLPRIIYLWRSHQQNLKYNRVPIVNAFHHRRAHPTSKKTNKTLSSEHMISYLSTFWNFSHKPWEQKFNTVIENLLTDHCYH